MRATGGVAAGLCERLRTVGGGVRVGADVRLSYHRTKNLPEVERVLGLGDLEIEPKEFEPLMASALEPDDERAQLVLGASHYRLGQLPEVEAALVSLDP